MSLARLVLARTEAELDAVANSISMPRRPWQRAAAAEGAEGAALVRDDEGAAFGNFVVGALSQENERDAQVFMTQFSTNLLDFF
jgi:hypothetical protein